MYIHKKRSYFSKGFLAARPYCLARILHVPRTGLDNAKCADDRLEIYFRYYSVSSTTIMQRFISFTPVRVWRGRVATRRTALVYRYQLMSVIKARKFGYWLVRKNQPVRLYVRTRICQRDIILPPVWYNDSRVETEKKTFSRVFKHHGNSADGAQCSHLGTIFFLTRK